MALINKWPQNKESFYDNKQWEAKNWTIGEPITKEKLQNLDNGIAILATQIKAILGEFNPSSLDGAQLNASRLDTIQKWITAAENSTYDLTKGSIATRLDSLATEVWGSNTTTGTSRIDKNDNKIAAIAAELGGTAPDGSSTTYGGTTRLDTVITKASSIATEIWGSDTTSGNSRIDNIESVNTNQNTEITNLKTRATNIESVNTTQNNRLTALENELSGNGTGTSGSSRLDNLQTWIAGGPTSTYSGSTIASRLGEIDTLNNTQNTRLNSLEASRASDEANVATLQTDNNTNKANISNIINEIGGTYTSSGFTNSQISKIPSIIEKNDTQDSNIGKIKTEIWGPDKDFNNESRIDVLESGLSTTNSTVAAHESRISRIETGAVAAKILNYTTTNTSASDNLILSADSLLDKNSIIMIFLNTATLGTNNLTIKDSTNVECSIKINNSNLKAKFAAGSLLGLYRGNTNDIYMFNAPLAI